MFWDEKFEGINLSENVSAEIKLHKIDPRKGKKMTVPVNQLNTFCSIWTAIASM
jgi:hypothetical protein